VVVTIGEHLWYLRWVGRFCDLKEAGMEMDMKEVRPVVVSCDGNNATRLWRGGTRHILASAKSQFNSPVYHHCLIYA
jgi:hypothetical protein